MSAAVDTPAVIAFHEALRLAEAGYKLAPVSITRSANGKKAFQFHVRWRHEDAWSNDPEQIKAWWTERMDTSFAIGGAANGIELVDLDVKPDEGIDAVRDWSERGLPVSSFMQRTPSGGTHLIWRSRADGLALPQEAGKTLGRGIDTRNRSGLVIAAGAYILGEEDHGHYVILGELPRLDALEEVPLEVIELFAEAAQADRERKCARAGTVAVHDEDWQCAQTELALRNIREHDRAAGGYRAKLQHAGLFLGRAVDQEFLSWERAEALILDAHRSVWGPAVWPENLKDVRDALRDGPKLERWRVPADPGPVNGSRLKPATAVHQMSAASAESDEDEEQEADSGQGEQVSDEEAERYEQLRKYREELAQEKRKQRLRREAAAELAAEERDPLVVLDADDFLNSAPPDYLVPKMFYRDGLAVVFGAPGAAKSFLVLDIALSLATGTPWRGRQLGRHRVHYVMAEGQATNVLRTKAWLAHRGVEPAALRGWFRAVPVAVMLTEPGIVDYLPVIEADQPDLIILDTKNLMFAGKESQGDDYGAMLRVLHKLRTAAGSAAVVLVDHSGLTDDTRTRGSNAQKGGVETEVRVSAENGVRRAEVTRDKSGQDGAQWLYKLEQVPEVPRPLDVEAPAVCVPVEADELATAVPFGNVEDWNDPAQPSLPDDVTSWASTGKTALRPLARFMRYSAPEGSLGFSLAQARKAVKAKYVDERGKPKFSDDTIDRAWNALVKLERLQTVNGGKETSESAWASKPGDPS